MRDDHLITEGMRFAISFGQHVPYSCPNAEISFPNAIGSGSFLREIEGIPQPIPEHVISEWG
jgi:hypothetical protein